MKSEKAEAFLSRVNDSAELFEPEESVVPYLDAVSAVEPAETDRDAKAVEAYKASCGYDRYCEIQEKRGCVCDELAAFIQKLNEE